MTKSQSMGDRTEGDSMGGGGRSDVRPLRIALVGAGRIGHTHIETVARSVQADLKVVVETRDAAGRAVATEHGSRYVADYRSPEILEAADAVIVCTPPNSHFEIASHFLENGLHVLCEKPLTLTVEEAQALVSKSSDCRRVLMMCSKFRYVEDVIKAKAIIEAGILGDIVLYENSFCSKVSMKDRWNSNRKIAGGGVLIDNGSHSVDIARYLLGPIREVQTQVALSAQGLEVEDTVRFQFRTARGVMGAVDLSWSVNKETDSYIRVYGAEGTLEVGWQCSRYRQDGSPRWVVFGSGYEKLAAFGRQLDNFVGTTLGREQPLITAEDALASVAMIEAAYRSADGDHWVRVNGS